MASIVLGVVGTAIGGPFGGMIGSYIGGYIDRKFFGPDPVNAYREGPRLEDLKVTTSGYGQPIPWVWGRYRLPGNVIWAEEIEEVRTEETVEQGGGGCAGGGGGGSVTTVTYSYYCTFAVAICKGPIDGVLRIWADSTLIYDISGDAESLDDPTKSFIDLLREFVGYVKEPSLNLNIYLGDETQEPDPIIESYEGEGNVPGHRGIAYVVFDRLPLNKFGNRIPNLNFEVASSATPIYPVEPVYGINNIVWGNDDFVKTYDDEFFVVQQARYWDKINNGTMDTVFSKYTEDIPGYAYNFDFDKEGYIYTDRYTSPNYGRLVKLHPDTFEEVAAAGENLSAWKKIRVSKSDKYPYVWGISYFRELFVVEQLDLSNPEGDLGAFTYSVEGMPSTGTMSDLCLDNTTGNCYVLYGSSIGASTIGWLVKVSADGFDVAPVDLSVYGWHAVCIAYDPGSNKVVVGLRNAQYHGGNPMGLTADHPILFFDGTTLAYLGVIDENLTGVYYQSAWQRGVIEGRLYPSSGNGDYPVVNVASQIVEKTYDLSYGVLGITLYGGSLYDPATESVYHAAHGSEDYGIYKILLNRKSGDSVKLWTIVQDICLSVGLTAGDLNVSELSDDVKGYALTGRMSARSAIQPLMDGYLFDGVESGGYLKFPKRGKDPVVTIGEGELATHPGGGGTRPQELEISRQQEVELPIQVDVQFIDINTDYERGEQRERRLTTPSESKESFSLPIVFNAEEGYQLAQIHLRAAWARRNKYNLSIPKKYLYLDPADNIYVKEGGKTYLLRLLSTPFSDGFIKLEAVSEDITIYTAIGSGVPGSFDHEESVAYAGTTILAIMDVGPIRDLENTAGLYYAAAGYNADWHGASIFRSSDGGQTYTNWEVVLNASAMGRAITTLGDFDHWYWDRGNEVKIKLFDTQNMALSSLSESEVLDGGNLAILGDEIIQFTTATQNSDGSWTLSNLLRGRKGTDWAKDSHISGDLFVLLQYTKTKFKEISLDDEDKTIIFKPVSFGQLFDSAKVTKSVNIQIRTLMPWSVQHINGTRDGSHNLTITWIRRSRIHGEWKDDHGVPLSEDSESYEVDILDYDGNVIRTITGITSETTTYTAAQQISDGPFLVGYTYGDDNTSFPNVNTKSVRKIELPAGAANIEGLQVYYGAAESGKQIKAIIYSDSGGSPGSLLHTGDEVTDTLEGWTDLPFSSPVTLKPGTYWIGVIGGTLSTAKGDYDSSSTGNYYNTDTYADGPSDPFGTPTLSYYQKPVRLKLTYAFPCFVDIYQISADVGRGHGQEATI